MSRKPRFFVPDLSPSTVTLTAHEAHHLVHVLRIGEGAPVELFDGKGSAAAGEVGEVRGKSVTVRVLSRLESRDSSLSLAIAVSVPKGDRMTWTVQKLTELGVLQVIPLLAERGELRKEACERNLARWRRVALESCKQSGRSAVPELASPKTLEETLAGHRGVALLALPGAEPLPRSIEPAANVLALVGPEGGWTEGEIELAASKNAVSFGLGPRTLRSETAAIAVAVLLQSMAGDLRR